MNGSMVEYIEKDNDLQLNFILRVLIILNTSLRVIIRGLATIRVYTVEPR